MQKYPEKLSQKWTDELLEELTRRPESLIEVRRDGKDDQVVINLIKKEFERRLKLPNKKRIIKRMREYASACWQMCDQMNQLMINDDQPENEKPSPDPDHWYEINLTNAALFANLTLTGLPQLVPGRLFTTRMPRIVVNDLCESAFYDKCAANKIKVVCVLTKPDEFEKYSGLESLLEFYSKECGLMVYHRAIPDFNIPTSGDLVNNILDLTFHLSQGENCLVHCAGGSGRTGMVIAAIVKNLGTNDPVAKIRRVKSTYVETYDQELFLRDMPTAIDFRILQAKPLLALAIAAQHLIQVFHTCRLRVESNEKAVKKLNIEDDSRLQQAYMQVFDLVDADGSGYLDKEELLQWLTMCGAQIDSTTIVETLVAEGNLSRAKFALLMSAYATSNRRNYDIGGMCSVIPSNEVN